VPSVCGSASERRSVVKESSDCGVCGDRGECEDRVYTSARLLHMSSSGEMN